MTTIYLILAICIGIAIAAAMLAARALRKCDDTASSTSRCVGIYTDVLNEFKRKLENLAACHDTIDSDINPYASFFSPEYTHYDAKAKTATAGTITLEELAKLVLDGTPIVRDVPTKTKYGVHKGEDDGKDE